MLKFTPPSEYSAPSVEVLEIVAEQVFAGSAFGEAGAAGAALDDLYENGELDY